MTIEDCQVLNAGVAVEIKAQPVDHGLNGGHERKKNVELTEINSK